MLGFYLKYLPGDVNTNVVLSSFADILSCLAAGFISYYIGSKQFFIFAYGAATIIGVLLANINSEE
jgi:hypothetical protein